MAMLPRSRLFRVVGIMLAAVLIAACSARVAQPNTTQILTGQVHAAEGAISIETGDWTYGVPLDGVRWVDAAGTVRESGRPDCLAPSATGTRVAFAAVDVTVNGSTWRPVVWVSCQQ